MSMTKADWLAQVYDIHGLDESDIMEIALICVRDSAMYISKLKAWTPGLQGREEMRRLAHSIRGSSANLAFTPMSEAAHGVEMLLKSESNDNYQELLARLDASFAAFKAMVES